MPRRPKYTREQLVETAVEIIRKEGIEALTARNLVGRLGTAPATIFTHFESMEALEAATFEAVYALYNSYVEEGLKMVPPFKGFGMRLVKFGMDEPNLFSFLNHTAYIGTTLEKAIEKEGHNDILISMIRETFSLEEADARSVLMDLWTYANGLAAICASGIQRFSDGELSVMLGRVARGLVLDRRNPDPRIALVPGTSSEGMGDMNGYIPTN